MTVVGEDVSEGARVAAMTDASGDFARGVLLITAASCGCLMTADLRHAGQMEQAGIQAGIPVQVKKQQPARLRFQVRACASCAGAVVSLLLG